MQFSKQNPQLVRDNVLAGETLTNENVDRIFTLVKKKSYDQSERR